MIVTVILIAAAFVIAAIVTAIVIASRRARAPFAVVSPPHVVGPARPYMEPLADEELASGPPLFDLGREPDSVPAKPAAPAEVFAPEPGASAEPFAPERAGPAEVRWSNQFDPRSGALDDTARLRLIGDLGVVATEWCVPLLCKAYEEERRPAIRQAALIALAACRSRTAVQTYRRALAADDEAERSIAADALADLEPPPKVKTRTTVERR